MTAPGVRKAPSAPEFEKFLDRLESAFSDDDSRMEFVDMWRDASPEFASNALKKSLDSRIGKVDPATRVPQKRTLFKEGYETAALPSYDPDACPMAVGKLFNPYPVQQAFGRYFRVRESVEKRRDLSPGAKLAHGALEYCQRYGIKDGVVSVKWLAEAMRTSQSQARRYIAELTARRLIEIDEEGHCQFYHRRRKYRPSTKNEYGAFVPLALIRYPDMPAMAKLVFGELVRRAGDSGKAWPSNEELCRALGAEDKEKKRTGWMRIHRALQALESAKLIAVLRPVPGGWHGVRAKDLKCGSGRNVYAFFGHEIFLTKK